MHSENSMKEKISELQEMACRIEIGIPKKDMCRDELEKYLIDARMCVSGIREICNCPIIGWRASSDKELVEEIPDFDSWGFEQLWTKPENAEYTVFRMYQKCYGPKYDIFGIKTRKPHATIEERTEKGMKIIINVTGRSLI